MNIIGGGINMIDIKDDRQITLEKKENVEKSLGIIKLINTLKNKNSMRRIEKLEEKIQTIDEESREIFYKVDDLEEVQYLLYVHKILEDKKTGSVDFEIEMLKNDLYAKQMIKRRLEDKIKRIKAKNEK
jgi:hypothetical protein